MNSDFEICWSAVEVRIAIFSQFQFLGEAGRLDIFTSYAADLLLNGLERRPDHLIKRGTGVVDVDSPGELRRRGS